jgi:hypothetical protein
VFQVDLDMRPQVFYVSFKQSHRASFNRCQSRKEIWNPLQRRSAWCDDSYNNLPFVKYCAARELLGSVNAGCERVAFAGMRPLGYDSGGASNSIP